MVFSSFNFPERDYKCVCEFFPFCLINYFDIVLKSISIKYMYSYLGHAILSPRVPSPAILNIGGGEKPAAVA